MKAPKKGSRMKPKEENSKIEGQKAKPDQKQKKPHHIAIYLGHMRQNHQKPQVPPSVSQRWTTMEQASGTKKYIKATKPRKKIIKPQKPSALNHSYHSPSSLDHPKCRDPSPINHEPRNKPVDDHPSPAPRERRNQARHRQLVDQSENPPERHHIQRSDAQDMDSQRQ